MFCHLHCPVSVNAADNIGVTRVDLRVNGVTVASTNVAPYQFAWDSTTVPDGPVALTAVAYDAAGNSTTSAAIALSVSNTIPLTVSIVSPTDGAVVTGSTQITTFATENGGSAGIMQKLYIDGKLKATVKNASLNYAWNAGKIAPGVHTILVTATDAAGHSTTKQVQVARQ